MTLGFGRAFTSVPQRLLIRLAFSYTPVADQKMCACPSAKAGTTLILLIHLPVFPRPIGIAQMAAQDFAGGIAWQRLDEVDRIRRLETDDALAAEVDDVRCRRLFSFEKSTAVAPRTASRRAP